MPSRAKPKRPTPVAKKAARSPAKMASHPAPKRAAPAPKKPAAAKPAPPMKGKPAPKAAKPPKAPEAPAASPRALLTKGHVLSLSFLRDGDEFMARLETDAGQITEIKNRSLDQLLGLVANELEDLLE